MCFLLISPNVDPNSAIIPAMDVRLTHYNVRPAAADVATLCKCYQIYLNVMKGKKAGYTIFTISHNIAPKYTLQQVTWPT